MEGRTPSKTRVLSGKTLASRGVQSSRLYALLLSRILFGVIFLLATVGSALAQEAGRVVSIVGRAAVFREGQWQPVSLGGALFPGQVIRTEPGSRVAIQLADESQLKINANSQLVLKQVAPWLVDSFLNEGRLESKS